MGYNRCVHLSRVYISISMAQRYFPLIYSRGPTRGEGRLTGPQCGVLVPGQTAQWRMCVRCMSGACAAALCMSHAPYVAIPCMCHWVVCRRHHSSAIWMVAGSSAHGGRGGGILRIRLRRHNGGGSCHRARGWRSEPPEGCLLATPSEIASKADCPCPPSSATGPNQNTKGQRDVLCRA